MVNRILKILLLTALIMMVFTTNGCLESKAPKQVEIDPGDFSAYEFTVPEGNFINSSTFFLYPNKTVRAIHTVVNAPKLEVEVPKDISVVKSEKGPGIDNLVIIGNTGSSMVFSDINEFSNVSYNVLYSESSRNKKIQFEFADTINGYVAYTYYWEQGQLYYILSRNETVNVVLPQDYDTGNIIFGLPKPKPDNKRLDDHNRIWLVWDNPNPKHQFIHVKYYRSSLPTVMGFVGLVLFVASLVTGIYFKNEIRKLQKKREIIEKDKDN
jgi:hypothetical protein